MPPKQRQGKGKATKKPEPTDKPAETSERSEQPTVPEVPGIKKKGGRCSSLLKRCAYFSLIIIVPTVLNYAALNQEAKALLPEGWSESLQFVLYM